MSYSTQLESHANMVFIADQAMMIQTLSQTANVWPFLMIDQSWSDYQLLTRRLRMTPLILVNPNYWW